MLTRMFLRKLAKEAQSQESSYLPKEITEIEVDASLPVEERKQRYVEDAVNSYLLRFGSIQIKVIYQEGGPSINDILADYFSKGGTQK